MLTTRESRRAYALPIPLFRRDGHIVLETLDSARDFAARLSARRADPASATDLYALSLLDEAFHFLIAHFVRARPALLVQGGEALQAALGAAYRAALEDFVAEYPPLDVFIGGVRAEAHLESLEEASSLLPEILLVHNINRNPALAPYRDLFDESVMRSPAYAELAARVVEYFGQTAPAGVPRGGPGGSLVDILIGPVRASPNSIEGQLRFLIETWGHLLGPAFTTRLLRGLDFLREEVIRSRGQAGFQAGAQLHTFTAQDYGDDERYSPDREWMPRLILLAKNTYVWLDQLSHRYQREIRRLDQIPDGELDLLAARGFTGLWLIGLWERSRASLRIKQRMGQEDAVASAYSLHAYEIAGDLGGWEALNNLRARAWTRGIRLSADMVPNHMGIDSAWVIEHPDWFLSLEQPPYPAYSFDSEDLSDDPRAAIRLEDHYYQKSDAAVVFQRRDRQSGEVRYIYHGNDGTSFPWNDTAQLDYTKAQVREAVIQTILHVARNFPVIRFDAAMTLARRHIQRLWFPEPGAGGAIPSRARAGLTRAEFDALVPNEFWREVVDRVSVEVPDTLLLAEAFWLMEGYFVRTLGMHRVYNSAFMHMLRDEDNAKYRAAIKNTLEFDPQILKRYVNFMNNPDEKTAVEQFGDGDKYFGVATLLATLPGLPMFGHGQVEGFHEKYGMEFRRPRWQEQPNEGLIRGHEWRIFPLLHRRHLFADVEGFHLYDFGEAGGGVNEDVFAFSNRHGEERALVVYHNRYRETRGWIRTSCAVLDKNSGRLERKNLAEALGLPARGFVIFRDEVTHLEYIRSCEELHRRGMFLELKAYQAHAFLDWRVVEDARWVEIHKALNGAGVPSLAAFLEEQYSPPPPPHEPAATIARRKKRASVGREPARGKAGKGRKNGETGGKPVVRKGTSSAVKSAKRRPVSRTKGKPPAGGTKKGRATRKTRTAVRKKGK